MIQVAVIVDEMRTSTGKGRGAAKAGTKVRHRAAVAVDKFNLVLAMSSGEGAFIGKKFAGKMVHLANRIREEGYDVKQAEQAVRQSIQRLFPDEPLDKATWDDFDRLGFKKRKDDSSGDLEIYEKLKQAGFAETDESDGGDDDNAV